jgi:hypothetical protein
MSKLVRRRRSASSILGVVLGTLALFLRLASPGPAVPPVPDADFAAALAEHALCLAAPSADDNAPLTHDQKPPGPGNHADHDGLGCCLYNATVGFTLPGTPEAAAIAFIGQSLPRLGPVAPTLPSRPTGPLQARAPPEAT